MRKLHQYTQNIIFKKMETAILARKQPQHETGKQKTPRIASLLGMKLSIRSINKH